MTPVNWPELLAEVLERTAPARLLAERLTLAPAGLAWNGGSLRWSDHDAIHLIAAGKPACAEAAAFLDLVRASPEASARLRRGLVVTREGYDRWSGDFDVVIGSHPEPEARSLAAGERVYARLKAMGPRDLAVFMVSGGSSALVEKPAPPHTLEEIRSATRALLREGAGIEKLNAVRAALSELKGGGWVRACGAGRILSLVSCDIPSGDPRRVGSGPAYPADARVTSLVLGDGRALVAAGTEAIRRRGFEPFLPGLGAESIAEYIVDEPVEEAVRSHLDLLARAVAKLDRGESARLAILSGGEAPVRVTGPGRGGRCSEFVLRMADALWVRRAVDLRGAKVTVAAMASDGTDGPTDFAGGWLTEDEVRGNEASLRESLASNDSLTYLQKSETALNPGPSAVNLMDLRVLTLER